MNEIFKDYSSSNACKQFECFSSKGGDVCGQDSSDDSGDKCSIFTKNNTNNLSIDENMVKYISAIKLNDLKNETQNVPDTNIITFSNDSDIDINKMVDTIISSSEDYDTTNNAENIDINETIDLDHNEPDNISVTSEITFNNNDNKYDKTLVKKYSKMSLDKLKEICNLNNITSDGTKKELMTRIIENTK